MRLRTKKMMASYPMSTAHVMPVDFVSEWKTDNEGPSNNDQIKLPLESGGYYNFTVNWGDSNTDHITTWNQAEVTHTYASSGTYTVTISGKIQGFQFNYAGDKLKILDVQQWGDLLLGDSGGYFFGCSNLIISASDAPNLSFTTSLFQMFRLCYALNQSLDHWNVSTITNLSNTFESCTSYNQPLNNWNTSAATDMHEMLFGCTVFNQPLNNWDTSSVTDMFGMLRSCPAFNQALNNWDTSSVTDMRNMFSGATIFNQDVSDWTVTAVTDATNMFLNSAFSTANYDLLLVDWEAQAVQNNVNFHAGTAQYNTGAPATARANLVADHTWTITDGGAA